MTHRFARFRLVLTHVGNILFVFGMLMLVPFVLSILQSDAPGQAVRTGTFAIPIAAALLVGALCRLQLLRPGPQRLGAADAMLICVLGWAAVSALGALPFSLHLDIGYLDAYFEAMSGFTTTGITLLSGLDRMPESLLLWRAMTQWIGGLGILTFFMAVVFQGGLSHKLFGAESHKIRGLRLAPGMWHTLKLLWLIYLLFTALIAGALLLCGMSPFDALAHALTCISTGGYSTHDASLAYYEQGGFAHPAAIQYVVIFGMWAGGTNFLVHYRVLRGELRALWDNAEVRAWWLVLGVSLALVLGSRLSSAAGSRPGESLRHGLFQVVAIASTTGYSTRDIGGPYFTPLARQVFLVLMFVGGCAGSTAGGFKVARLVIMWKLMVGQVRRATRPPSSVELLMMDGKPVRRTEIYRTAGLLFAWAMLVLFSGLVTAALSRYGALASASGGLSAVSNIGPCYIPAAQMADLHPLIKLVYIAGMLAGRLELIPVLMLLSPRTWKWAG